MAATTTIACPRNFGPAFTPGQAERRSAHSFILEAVERHADYEEQMRSLAKEAIGATQRSIGPARSIERTMCRLDGSPGTRHGTDRPKPWRR